MVVNTAAPAAERVQFAGQGKLGTVALKQSLQAEQTAAQLTTQAAANQAAATPNPDRRGQIVDILA